MSLDQLNKFLEEDKIEKNIQPDLPIDQKIPANEACEGKNNSEVSNYILNVLIKYLKVMVKLA